MKDIEDEIPFEVPEGWAWCRLFSLVDLFNGDRGVNYPSKSDFVETGIPFVNAGCLSDGVIDYSEANMITQKKYDALRAGKYQKGDILYCLRGSLGKTGIVLDDSKGAISSSLCILRSRKINIYFLHIFLKSSAMKGQQQLYDNGTAQPNLAAKDVASFYLPLPPLEEQEKIVSKIEEIFTQIDYLETSKADLQTAIKHAKSKILDLAIHGKLVPQNSSEEPASKLLERIRAEKEAKIAAGELKRDKNDSYIYKNPSDNCHYEKFVDKEICIEDEIPFSLPNGWCWCRLKNIVLKLVDGDHNPPKGVSEETEYKMLSSRNINYNRIVDLQSVRYLTKETFDEENKRTQLTTGDILFTSVGSLGRSCLFNGTGNYCFQRSVTVVNTNQYNPYIKFCFDSTYYQKLILENATGTAQLGFYLEQMSKSLIPIPPFDEQKRIVSKITEITEMLDTINQALL